MLTPPHSASRIAPEDISGLVLCGGRGSRMGGVDKGLQSVRGQPLVRHVLSRLAPQVGPVLVSANRNLGDYAALGVPVWPDSLSDHPGPLAGWLAGLEHCSTRYLATAPCDTPGFPADLVSRLAAALAFEDAEIAMAATLEAGAVRPQPVFCLLDVRLAASLRDYLLRGGRKVDRWTAQHRCAQVLFDDAPAFFNANTLHDLERLRSG